MTKFTPDIKEEFVEQVERATEWLKLCEQTKHLDRRQTSYGIKHEAERWCREQGHPNGGYISNGALLMAAYTLGFKVQRPKNRIFRMPFSTSRGAGHGQKKI